jgi:HK97 gp10 family phage protein
VAEQIQGLAALQRQLAALEPSILDAIRDAVKESAQAVHTDLDKDVPVDTGKLKRGMKITYRARGLAADVGATDPRLYYLVFLHNGTSSIPALPFITAAQERERTHWRGRLETHINRALS